MSTSQPTPGLKRHGHTTRILRILLRSGKSWMHPNMARAELGFEARLMAQIRGGHPIEPSYWWVWNRLLWRLMPAFAAVVLAIGAWNWFAPAPGVGTTVFSPDPLGLELALFDHLLGGAL